MRPTAASTFLEAAFISLQSLDSLLALSLIVWHILWFIRYQQKDPTVIQDAYIFMLSELWAIYARIANDCQRAVLWFHVLFVVSVLVIISITRNYRQDEGRSLEKDLNRAEWAKPLIFPSRTTHSRFIPRKHSFSYSYLLIGIPIDLCGKANGFLSVNASTKTRFSIFSVHASDYLDRDSKESSLRGKVDSFLQQQHVEPRDFPRVYLVTAPRVFGYSFNPASFWYLYSADNKLGAMIVEVNNTFDERKVYFLRSTDTPDTQPSRYFTSKWEKDFHVSPFNSREGMYTLLAQDPVPSGQAKDQAVSNTITLLSPEGQAKIVARIFSSGPPIDIATLGTRGVLQLLFRFGWIGFLTFPRILAEARKLYFWRNLPVWYRPEVRTGSIARRYTPTERFLATFFSRYLQHLVENSKTPISVKFSPAPDREQGGLQKFTSKVSGHDELPVVEVKILSPGFYSRFVHYAHTSEAFDNECHSTEDENRTIFISRPDLFARLFPSKTLTKSSQQEFRLYGRLDQLRWKMLRMLRCPPGRQSYTSTMENQKSRTKDIRYFPYSQLDAFVMQHCNDAWLYRRKASGLFMAQRLAFGVEPVIALLDKLLRFITTSIAFYVVLGATLSGRSSVQLSWSVSLLSRIFQLSIIHIWSLAKGL